MARDNENQSRWGSRRSHRQYQHEEMDDRERGTRDGSRGRDRPRGAGPEGTSQHHESHEHQNVGRGHAQHSQGGQSDRGGQSERHGQNRNSNHGQPHSGQQQTSGRDTQGRVRQQTGQTDTRQLSENEHMGRRYGRRRARGHRGQHDQQGQQHRQGQQGGRYNQQGRHQRTGERHDDRSREERTRVPRH